MVPNIARDARISRNIAVLCQEVFEFPDVTLTSPLKRSTSSPELLGFCHAPLLPEAISFILEFTALSRIRPGPRLNFALAVRV